MQLQNLIQPLLAIEADTQEILDNVISALSRLGSSNVRVVPAMRGVPVFGLDVSFFYERFVNSALAK